MSERKSLLLLGGARQQVVAIEAAKRLGYRTVLCDYLPDNPGQFVADSFHLASTTDREAVLEVAREEDVSGALAYASDPAAPTAAFVAEELGLPTNPLWAVEIMSEKHRFRAFLEESGLPCPRSVSFAAGETMGEVERRLSRLRLPVVVKPTDSSGSKGVAVLGSLYGAGEAVARATSFSRNGVLIAEEYVEKGFPHVVGGDIFVVDGEVRFWGLMSCLRDDGLGGLVPVGEFLPSSLSDRDLRGVKAVLRELVQALGIRFGELNVEVIVGRDGVPYVLELGARAGGNMIPVQLSDASGVDLAAASVLCAMGEDPGPLDWEPEGEAFATYVLHSGSPGTFGGIRIDPALARHVYRTVMYVSEGDWVEAFDGADKALGIVFLRFDDERQMAGVLAGIGSLISPIMGADL